MTYLLPPANPWPPQAGNVYQMDALQLMDALARYGVMVDAIITDLPYGTTACSWDTVIPFAPMWAAVKRILKPRGVFVTTASQPFTSALVMSNPEWFKYTTIWVKSRGSGFINAKNQPISIHEDIVVFSPGTVANCSTNRMTYNPQGLEYKPYHKKRLKPMTAKEGGYLGRRPSHVSEYDVEWVNYPKSVVYFANPNDDNEHPTQKPVALYRYLIETYTQPGELVLDFCCGSGTTALAARECGRRFIVGDTSAEYVAIARDRLRLPFEPRHVSQETRLDDLPMFAAFPAAG